MGSNSNVLLVGEDENSIECVSRMGFRPVVLEALDDASNAVRRISPAFVLLNAVNGGVDRIVRELSPSRIPILLITDRPAAEHPFNNGGNIHVLSRPISQEALQATIQAALPGLVMDGRLGNQYLIEYAPFFDGSPSIRAIKEIIEKVADTNATVLLRGESGVGKDLVARAVHAASPRSAQPFVKVNCAALPTELLETELFGHEKGAFTGAYRRKLGKFEFARNGTLFLDEIGELPLSLQAKLLHVLQDCEFSRLGGRELIRVNTRIIASTNLNLEAALSTGHFREDLYYRLNVVEIQVPPLRNRKEEIPLLAEHFLDTFQRQYRRHPALPPETLAVFMEYSWPGNIRELENTIRRLVVLGNAQQIHQEIASRLAAKQAAPSERAGEDTPADMRARRDITLGLREIAKRAAREAERMAIRDVLDRVHWNRTEAARLLKVSYKTLLSKIAECGLAPKQRRLKA